MGNKTELKTFSRISNDILGLTWEDKVKICQEWQRSGLSKGVFCKRRGISSTTFYGWRKRLLSYCKDEPASKLCAVNVIDREGITGSKPIVLEVSFPNTVTAKVTATESQFSFLLRELLDATAIIR